MTSPVKITVAGAGFAALTGIKELRKQLPDAELTLVAPNAEFIYLPSLIWVPYGMRKGDETRRLIAILDQEYFSDKTIFDLSYSSHDTLSRPQIEIVAAKVSEFNQCFY